MKYQFGKNIVIECEDFNEFAHAEIIHKGKNVGNVLIDGDGDLSWSDNNLHDYFQDFVLTAVREDRKAIADKIPYTDDVIFLPAIGNGY